MQALPPFDPGFEMTVSSRGMSKGIEQSDEPQVIPKLYVQVGDLQLGGQWKNVTSTTAKGEGAAFLNVNRRYGAYALSLGAAYKFQTRASPATDSRSLEFGGSVTRKIGRLSLRGSAIYSPDDLGRAKRSLYLEAGPTFELTKSLRVSANLSHRSRRGSPDYTAINFGATKTLFPAFSLDVRYYRTDRSELGAVYHGRLIIAGRWTF